MSFRIDTNIWFDLFTSFLTYLKTEIYPYNETGIEIMRIIYEINEDEYISDKIPGNTFVSSENTIYDQDSNIVRVCEKKDKFTLVIDEENGEKQDYFICDYNNVAYPISDKNNNTRIGDKNIYVSFGEVDLDASDPIPINELPSIKFTIENEDPTDALATIDNDTPRFLNFSIRIIVSESDLHTNIGATGYDETNRVKALAEQFIYDYYNSVQCKIIDAENVGQRIYAWNRAWNMLAERNNDNIRISEIVNNIEYK